MPNRRFEMYQYRHILVRMRMGDSNRAIADSGVAGRNKVKAIKRIALEHGWRSGRRNLQRAPSTHFMIEGSRRRRLPQRS